MWKRWYVVPLITMLALTACSSKDGGGAQKSTDPVKLLLTSEVGGAAKTIDDLFANAIRKKFPDYEFTYLPGSTKGQSISEQIAQGNKMDYLYSFDVEIFWMMKKYGLQFDMTPLIKKHKLDLTQFTPGIIEGLRASSGGELYALPLYDQVFVLFYNKGIFDKFGVPYPRDGMTWDETLAIARNLTREEDGTRYLGFWAHPLLFSSNQLSLPLADFKTEAPTFLNDTWKKLLDTYFIQPARSQTYQTFVKEKGLPSVGRDFGGGTPQLAMMAMYQSFSAEIPDQLSTIDWDFVSLPTFSDKPGTGAQPVSVVMGLTSMSKNPDEAMEVLKFLVSEEMQTSFAERGMMTVLKNDKVKSALGKKTPYPNKNWASAYYNKNAPTAPVTRDWNDLYGSMNSTILPMIKGEEDMNTLLRRAQELATKAVAERKASDK
ncbi:ABC transporter substrate-binding protein [Paenibacillus ginsengarvi]|uniref:Extracellular solute-binding protein n=1 Tax=Paenibacillus ginsengarvi TaxID=400777 RepID=A0A3B0CIC3_9BACL|nr:extracellular solute-binding protein [Paenibacillus ginsengarvi]RKN83736.1 extracellular solute-binding protein [Paenibacillus ginsengarvi]